VLTPWLLPLCAAALSCWPPHLPDARLVALSGRCDRWTFPPKWRRFSWRSGLGFGPVVLALILAGPAGAVAAALLTLACWQQWRDQRSAAAKILAAEGIADALSAMVAELRAGAHPMAAAESAAIDAAPEAAAAMRMVAASARLGPLGEDRGGTADRLAKAWSLVREHGLPMADVLDAVRRDVVTSVRFARQTRARMAGPRASSGVLALLPCVGVALGEAMGASPIHVLFSTPPGQVMLVTGCALIWAGMAWSAKVTEQAVLR
jgi:tight adherence protein B